MSTTNAMPVVEAAESTPVAANCVYVIPNATLHIADCKLRVSKPAPARAHRRPVDTFFSSLAEDQEENAVGTAAYVERLQNEPHETELFFRELLIGVTRFFRDP